MGIINLTEEQKSALSSISTDELRTRIDKAIDEKRVDSLYGLRLSLCGPYVEKQYSEFQRDLVAFAQAKSGRKWEETGERVRRSAYKLTSAVMQMQSRMETQEREGQLFYIDDYIIPPITPGPHISFRVIYRWRKTVDDEWEHGSIEFTHTVVTRSDYGALARKRKPTAREQREQQERACYDAWESLMRGALYHVQEYFRKGKSGSDIPKSFVVKTDTHGYLNNFSTKFWNEEPLR